MLRVGSIVIVSNRVITSLESRDRKDFGKDRETQEGLQGGGSP